MSSSAFDKYPLEYDQWFDNNKAAYQSEIDAIRKFIPAKGEGIEIGVGTGRFSIPFNITIGVDPSEEMAAIARSRGINVHISYAENLSFGTNTFDYALLVTTICFVQNPELALKEIIRILKPNGKIILAIIDKGSELGKKYESLKTSNKFYK
jgi:ubiquinone/menaquinone biosynthesis C-methylase UbiE